MNIIRCCCPCFFPKEPVLTSSTHTEKKPPPQEPSAESLPPQESSSAEKNSPPQEFVPFGSAPFDYDEFLTTGSPRGFFSDEENVDQTTKDDVPYRILGSSPQSGKIV